MANNTWSNYTEKTATPVDTDEVMARDSTDGKNKRLLFGTFWKWVAKKLNEATIPELQTNNKTVIGAINKLNSESLIGNVTTIDGITFDYNSFTKTGLYYIDGPKNQSEGDNRPGENITNCFMLVLAKTDYRCFQIVFPGNTPSIFYRNTKTDSSKWNSWKAL